MKTRSKNKIIKEQIIENCEANCCPVETTMNIIGKRWTALIIRDLASGTKRYCELERLLDNISPKVLSQRLSELEQQQIVKREVIAEVPVRVEYSLTAKGKDLVKVIDSMAAWGQQYQG